MTETDTNLNVGNSNTSPVKFDEAGKPKSKAVGSANQALTLAKRMELDDRQVRDVWRARVQSAFNGNAPYDADELKKQGQDWVFNLSFGWLEGLVGRALAPFIRLAADVNKLGLIEGRIPDEQLKVIREELVEIMKEWGGWLSFYIRWIQEMVLHGWSTALMPTIFDPFPRFSPQAKFFVPEGSSNVVREIEVAVWRKDYLPHELYREIEDEETAKTLGWELENTRKAITAAEPWSITDNKALTSWETVEKAFRDGVLATSMLGQKQIVAYHVFVPELMNDGKVTHWIVVDTKGEGDMLLYKKEGKFDSLDDVIVYTDLEPGNETWYGPKGVGRKGYNTHTSIDRLRCEGLNQVFLGGLIPAQMGENQNTDDMEMAVLGRLCVVPNGVSLPNTKFPSLSQEFFQADALLQKTTEERIGDVVPDARNQLGGEKTATQSKIDYGEAVEIEEAQLMRFVDPLGKIFSLIVRRLSIPGSPNKWAQLFQQRCAARGVGLDVLKNITGNRAFGQIGQALGKEARGNAVIWQEFRGDPYVDQVKIRRNRISDLRSPELADDLIIKPDDPVRTLEATNKQQVESAAMQNGATIKASPQDDHKAEFNDCLKTLANMVTAARAGGQVNLQTYSKILAHAQEHLAFMAQSKADPEGVSQGAQVLKEFERELQILAAPQITAQIPKALQNQ